MRVCIKVYTQTGTMTVCTGVWDLSYSADCPSKYTVDLPPLPLLQIEDAPCSNSQALFLNFQEHGLFLESEETVLCPLSDLSFEITQVVKDGLEIKDFSYLFSIEG